MKAEDAITISFWIMVLNCQIELLSKEKYEKFCNIASRPLEYGNVYKKKLETIQGIPAED